MVYVQGSYLPQDIWRVPVSKTTPSEQTPEKLITSTRSDQWPAYSPDSRKIAFSSKHGGVPRVWKVTSRGGTPKPFEQTLLSQSLTLAWSPGRSILYQRPGNRNFHFLDPESERETPLV